jgi:hypothetical protein
MRGFAITAAALGSLAAVYPYVFVVMALVAGSLVDTVQWLMGVILDARWHGLAVEGARVYPPAAYEAAFTLCLGVAVAALVAATRVTETRCRNVGGGGRGRPRGALPPSHDQTADTLPPMSFATSSPRRRCDAPRTAPSRRGRRPRSRR